MTEAEKRLIGMSDAAALLGLDPNRTAFDVWNRVVAGIDTPDSPIMERGRRFEPVIRVIAQEDFGLELMGPRSLRDPKRAYVRGTLDDEHGAGLEPVELKSVSPWAAQDYGPDGTDLVPERHVLQCQGYLRLTGAPRAHLVALIGLDDPRHYVIEADEQLQGVIFEAIDRFYVDYVESKKAPPLDGTTGCSTWLASRFPRNETGIVLLADNDAERWAERYHSARLAKEEAEAMEKEARNHLVERIANAEGLRGQGWSISYRFAKGRSSIDKAALERDGLLAKYSKQGEGGRRFLPKFAGLEGSDE